MYTVYSEYKYWHTTHITKKIAMLYGTHLAKELKKIQATPQNKIRYNLFKIIQSVSRSQENIHFIFKNQI